jgi:hypothetical protein
MLLHLDSHDDLGTPLLRTTRECGRFTTVVGNDLVDLTRPGSVARAVRRGAVGIGSFIAPFLHSVAVCDYVHVCPGVLHEQRHDCALVAEPVPAAAIAAGSAPAVRVQRHAAGSTRAPAVSHVFTTDLAVMSELRPAGPVLLDIDMDFFCNHLDSRRVGPMCAADDCHSVDAINRQIRSVGAYLHDNDALWSQLAVVTVALSPGFFPSRYWSSALAQLDEVIAA